MSHEPTHSAIALGARDAIPVGLGYIPLGMGMGMTLTGAGLDWWWAPIFALVMYAGSMQYLVVPMIVAHEPLAGIALTTLLIQFRHVFYGISFPLDLVQSRLARLYSIHALTDEVYAVVASKPRSELTGERVIWTQVFSHATWVTGCTLGALVGLAVPIDGRILNFVLTSLFIVLMLEAYLANRARLDFALAAGIGVVALLLPASVYLPIALTVLTLALLVSSRFAYPTPDLFNMRRHRRDGMP
ncbi:AzlC family ABC transporter permease [Trueperella pecoris]|uniref:AzlC family ABC transporter permease n=1 Tax=Trueperella pecoris TaxID=2733571 RepID=UPI00186BB0B9|nr:AzlC family ABC transporter permease [Trueperella pecoris]QOQ38653.1 AzlC family ABC transporter permease [Trueperella pecoris]